MRDRGGLMRNYIGTKLTAAVVLAIVASGVAGQGAAQLAPVSGQQSAVENPCAPNAGRGRATAGGGQTVAGRGQAPAGRGTAPVRKRVLAWADSRNGRAQHEYVSYALAQLQRMGRDSGAYDVIIRTDSDIISFTPKMTDGTTPASGGPSLCNIDAILYAGHRNVPLSVEQKRDLVSALRDRGVGFVSLFIGMLPNTDWPEMHNILGTGNAASDVHDPFGNASTFINERPDSPFTKHLPRVWDLPNGAVYHPDAYTRDNIDVILRKDLSKLAPVADYT